MNCLCWDALTPWISQREAVVQRAPLLERSRWPHHFDACDGRGRSWFWDDWEYFQQTEGQSWLQRKMNEIKWESTNITWPTTMLLLLLQTCLLLRLYDLVWFWYEKFLNMISSSSDLSRYDSVGWNQGLIVETYWTKPSPPRSPLQASLNQSFYHRRHIHSCAAVMQKHPDPCAAWHSNEIQALAKKTLPCWPKPENCKPGLQVLQVEKCQHWWRHMETSCLQSKYIHNDHKHMLLTKYNTHIQLFILWIEELFV